MNTEQEGIGLTDSELSQEYAEVAARLRQILVWSVVICALGCGALLSIRGPIQLQGKIEDWATLTVAIVFQAAPFLILGVALSAAIAIFVPDRAFRQLRRLPRAALIPSLAGAGAIVPGCECSSVPLSKSLIERGVPPAAAFSFMLASPTINPIVLTATAVAFPSNPNMVWARLGAGLLAACLVGMIWSRFSVGNRPVSPQSKFSSQGRHRRGRLNHRHSHRDSCNHDHRHGLPGETSNIAGREKWRAVCEHIIAEFASAGGFLVGGAMVAALLKVLIPIGFIEAMETNLILACFLMAALAILMSVCSEADAFIAASFSMISPVAQLVFLVVGPMVDLKLIAMHYGAWGTRFVVVFAPLTVACAMLSSAFLGQLLF